jgi:hypothetical protein
MPVRTSRTLDIALEFLDEACAKPNRNHAQPSSDAFSLAESILLLSTLSRYTALFSFLSHKTNSVLSGTLVITPKNS